jgi:pimeloyl-ACP methyl ester carboxylesterase
VRPWGFDPAAIRIPVRLWHGTEDIYAPVAHTRWLAGRIPGAEIEIRRATGHFGAIEALPTILSWLSG